MKIKASSWKGRLGVRGWVVALPLLSNGHGGIIMPTTESLEVFYAAFGEEFEVEETSGPDVTGTIIVMMHVPRKPWTEKRLLARIGALMEEHLVFSGRTGL